MSENRYVHKFVKLDKLYSKLDLDDTTLSGLKILLNEKGVIMSETEVQLTVPERSSKRSITHVRVKKEDRKAYKKYLSTSGKRALGDKQLSKKEKFVIKKEVPIMLVDLNIIKDADKQLAMYDYWLANTETLDQVDLVQPQTRTFVKITGDSVKKSTLRVLTNRTLKQLFNFTNIINSRKQVVLETVDEEDIDDDRLQLAVNVEVKKAILDDKHPLHRKVLSMLEKSDISEAELQSLNTQGNIIIKNKETGKDEVLK